MRKIVLAILLFCPASCLFADDADVYFNFALGMYRGNHYQNAIQSLKNVLEVDKNNWKAHQLMGYCDYMLGDKKGALKECQLSLKHHGDNPRLEIFADSLEADLAGMPRKHEEYSFWEGKAEAKMPIPPDQDPERNPDRFIKKLEVPVPAPKAPDHFFENFLFQLGPGAEILGQNLYGSGKLGLGGQLAVGYELDDHWSIWLGETVYVFMEQHPYYFGGSGIFYQGYSETTLSARYAFGEGPFKPYLGAGLGYLVQNGYDFYHMIQGSLGAQLRLGETLSAFVETKGNFILVTTAQFQSLGNYLTSTFTQVTGIDYPINAGLILDFWGNHRQAGQAPLPIFLKTGWGSTFDSNDYPNARYMPANTTSIAAGVGFPNHFSFFTSLDRFPGDWAVLVNLQYTLEITAPFQPYLFIGLGLDFPAGPTTSGNNNAVQAGAGLDFNLNPTLDLFAEVKAFGASNFINFGDSYLADAGVFEMGLKFNLSGSPAPAVKTAPVVGGTGSSLEPAHPKLEPQLGVSAQGKLFVEMAGGIDLPAQNWQSAYSLGTGGKFCVGYEFNDGLEILLDMEDFDYSGTNYVGSIGDHELMILPTVRYPLLRGGIRPYLSLGAGLDMEVAWANGGNPGQVGNFDLALGAGLEVPFDPLNSFFVEGKYNFIFAYGAIGQDIPILAGIKFGFH